tara:strand:+ start:270 stop:410 length:141 start_codon:yes stop_codon:yes gene_type:complete
MNKLQMNFMGTHIHNINRIADALERIAKVMEEEKSSDKKKEPKNSK